MPQISRRKLPKKLSDRMWLKFSNVIIKTSSPQQVHILFSKLLTKTERVMLSKRLMSYFLLASQWEPVVVAELLKLSTSTVYKYQSLLDSDKDFCLYLQELTPEKIENLKTNYKATTVLDDLVTLFEDLYAGRQDRSRLLYGKTLDFDVSLHRNTKGE